MSKVEARTKRLVAILIAPAVSSIITQLYANNSVSVGGMYTGFKEQSEALDNPCTDPGCNNSKWTPWTCKDDCQTSYLNCISTCSDEDQQCKSTCNRELNQCKNKCWLL